MTTSLPQAQPAPPAPRGVGWLDTKEAAARMGVTERRILQLCLSQWLAAGLALQQSPQGGGKPAWHIREDAHPLLARAPSPEHLPFDIGRLSAEHRRKLQGRREILAAWMAALDSPPIAALTTERQITADFVARLYADERVSLSARTLFLWRRQYRQRGVAGLVDGRWQKPKQAGGDCPFLEELRRLYLDQRQRSQTLCYEYAADLARENGWDIPSDRTARRYLASIPLKTVLLFRKGKEAYNNLAAPYIERDYTSIDSNDVWVGDHHELDIRCDDGQGKGVRFWLTAWQDMRSRMIVGWCIFNHAPNSDTILSSFRAGCLAYGVPKKVLIDNGKDFDAAALQGETKKQRFRRRGSRDRCQPVDAGVFGLLDVEVQHALPYRPQGKPVERAFGTLCGRFSKLFDTYCGNSPLTRPDDLDDKIKRGKMPTLDEVRTGFADWLDADYHAKAHHGNGMDGRSPAVVFAACLRSKRTATPEMLDQLTLRKTRPLRIGRNGVTWRGIRYGRNQPELSSNPRMQVTLRVDDRNLSKVLVYRQDDDSFLCIAHANQTLPVEADSQLLRESMAENRRDEKTAKAFHEARPRLADSLTDRLHRKAAAHRAGQDAAPHGPDQIPPPSLLPIRAASIAAQQLEKVRAAIELEKRRPAIGSESVPALLDAREFRRRLRAPDESDGSQDAAPARPRISNAELRRLLRADDDPRPAAPCHLRLTSDEAIPAAPEET